MPGARGVNPEPRGQTNPFSSRAILVYEATPWPQLLTRREGEAHGLVADEIIEVKEGS